MSRNQDPTSSSTAAARRAERQRRHNERMARRYEPALVLPGAWSAWFDGSALPNPGRIGIGALLCGPHGQRIEISRAAGEGSSSVAEYLALIAVLEAALPLGAPQLLVYGDSRVVIDDVNQPGPGGASGLQALRARALELMGKMEAVSLHWLPRHRNAAADALSQRARGQAPNQAPSQAASG
ncbi:ribonuclease HI family protein [Oxalobacteraceae bacterium A2-2]